MVGALNLDGSWVTTLDTVGCMGCCSTLRSFGVVCFLPLAKILLGGGCACFSWHCHIPQQRSLVFYVLLGAELYNFPFP